MIPSAQKRSVSMLLKACTPRTRTITAAASSPAAGDSRNKPRKSGIGRQRPTTDRHDHRTLTNSTATGSAALSSAQADAYAYNMNMLNRHRALILDSSYRPIEIVHWQRALCMHILNKADVLEYYEQTVQSVKEQFFLPAVLRTRWYHGTKKTAGRVSLNRRNILLRDSFTCQYCGKDKDLTIDHVLAASRGGTNSWENLVTACSPCNAKKGSKTLKELKWKLLKQPREPSPYEINAVVSTASALKEVPTEWSNYLFTSQDED